jgi:ubiquinone/menaquinone biosynthesis C-methylase UbiE
MEINYQETTKDLLTRIDIHKKYGGRDIDQWMIDLLKPAPGSKILDIGCGAGKQCFLYLDYTKGNADITGGDVSQELLTKAHSENEKRGKPVKFMELNFNKQFQFIDNTFDLESSCFAIYYATDIPFTIKEMHRVLKPGGRLFTTGPLPANKKLFYDIIQEASGKPIPPMPGSSRYESMILEKVKQLFLKAEMHVFENPLTFKSVQPFIDYTKASLGEDRKLWTSLFNGPKEFDDLMSAIEKTAEKRLQKDGQLVMTKVVGGILATK